MNFSKYFGLICCLVDSMNFSVFTIKFVISHSLTVHTRNNCANFIFFGIMHPARSIIYRIVIVALIMMTVLSCIREEFDPDKLNNSVQINPNVGAPIGFLHFNLESMLNDSTRPDILEIHPDGSMTLRYKQRIFTDSLDNLFSFEDFSTQLNMPNEIGEINLGILPGDTSIVINYTKKFDFIEDVNMNADYRIDSIRVRPSSTR